MDSKAQMRVKIAKDVLKQLKIKKVIPDTIYCSINSAVDRKEGEQLQKIISEKETTCKVCALGALFISQVALKDNFKICHDYSRFSVQSFEMQGTLEKYFDYDQITLIEHVYMAWVELIDYREEWIVKSHEQRMTYIMKNIIKNKGTFVLTKDVGKKLKLA